MNASKSHYCKDREQRENLLRVFTRFLLVFERAFCRKSPISTGRNGRLKLGKLLNLIWHIGDKNLNQTICNIIASGSRIFSNAGRFY